MSFSSINAAENLLNFGVEENGLYRVSHEQLSTFGLDISGQKVADISVVSGANWRRKYYAKLSG